jgi:hypothetical protein
MILEGLSSHTQSLGVNEIARKHECHAAVSLPQHASNAASSHVFQATEYIHFTSDRSEAEAET